MAYETTVTIERPWLKWPITRKEIKEELKVSEKIVRQMLREAGIDHSNLLKYHEVKKFNEFHFGE